MLPSNNRVPVAQAAVYIDGAVLPPEIMSDLISIEVDLSLDVPDMALICFHDNKLELVNSSRFEPGKALKVGMTAEAVTPTSGAPSEVVVFLGEIVGLEPRFEAGGLCSLAIRAYDRRHRLTRETKMKTYVQKTHSDIVAEIASANGMTAEADSTTIVYEHLLQKNQTDLEFLQELAAYNGYELACNDRKLIFRKRLESNPPVATLKWGEDLIWFTPRLSAAGQVNQVTVKGWDIVQKQALVGQATNSSSQPAIGFGKWGGQTAQSAFSAAKHFEIRKPMTSQNEANELAKAILNTLNENFIEAEGVCYGNPAVKPGTKVQVENLGAMFNGKYLITSVTHQFRSEVGLPTYTTHFRVEGARRRLMMDLLQPDSPQPSKIYGLVPAIVTNIEDSEKDIGRVKVKYPWFDDTLESGWARVVALGAGNSTGFYWLPQVNDEVLVGFEHGDMNRPYVLGGVWNDRDKPPVPINQAVSNGKVKAHVIKSRGGHILRFIDDDSDSKIEIIDSKVGTTIILDSANKNLKITTENEISHKGKTITTKGESVTVESSGSLTIKGSNITVEASGQLTLKGATVNIN